MCTTGPDGMQTLSEATEKSLTPSAAWRPRFRRTVELGGLWTAAFRPHAGDLPGELVARLRGALLAIRGIPREIAHERVQVQIVPVLSEDRGRLEVDVVQRAGGRGE